MSLSPRTDTREFVPFGPPFANGSDIPPLATGTCLKDTKFLSVLLN